MHRQQQLSIRITRKKTYKSATRDSINNAAAFHKLAALLGSGT